MATRNFMPKCIYGAGVSAYVQHMSAYPLRGPANNKSSKNTVRTGVVFGHAVQY